MIRNIHERTIQAPASVLAPLLDGLGRDGDRLWPAGSWTPMVLDRPRAGPGRRPPVAGWELDPHGAGPPAGRGR